MSAPTPENNCAHTHNCLIFIYRCGKISFQIFLIFLKWLWPDQYRELEPILILFISILIHFLKTWTKKSISINKISWIDPELILKLYLRFRQISSRIVFWSSLFILFSFSLCVICILCQYMILFFFGEKGKIKKSKQFARVVHLGRHNLIFFSIKPIWKNIKAIKNKKDFQSETWWIKLISVLATSCTFKKFDEWKSQQISVEIV